MLCLAGFAAALGPRVAVAFWWLFGNKVELAFDSWIWPLLGIIFLPWTTLTFLIASEPGGVNGNWEVALIVLGVALDVLTYMHRFAAKAAKAVRPSPQQRY